MSKFENFQSLYLCLKKDFVFDVTKYKILRFCEECLISVGLPHFAILYTCMYIRFCRKLLALNDFVIAILLLFMTSYLRNSSSNCFDIDSISDIIHVGTLAGVLTCTVLIMTICYIISMSCCEVLGRIDL
jgi:hypothetical protein